MSTAAKVAIALVALVIVGGAVGGGVAGYLATSGGRNLVF